MIKIIHADRNIYFRKEIKKQLEEKFPIDVACSVDSFKEIIKEVSNCNPDVLMTDWRLQDSSSFYFLPAIKAQFPKLKILMLTMKDDVEFIEECKPYFVSMVSMTASLDEIVREIIDIDNNKLNN